MSADFEVFAVRYKEHTPTEGWDQRKIEIAEKLASFADYDYEDGFSENAERGYCDLWLGDEIYGDIEQMRKSMIDYLIKNQPDVDFEFHHLESYGDITDYIIIYENGKKNKAERAVENVEYALEAVQELWEEEERPGDPPEDMEGLMKVKEYRIPKKSDRNPYQIPKIILSDDEEFPPAIVWFCDQFK